MFYSKSHNLLALPEPQGGSGGQLRELSQGPVPPVWTMSPVEFRYGGRSLRHPDKIEKRNQASSLH